MTTIYTFEANRHYPALDIHIFEQLPVAGYTWSLAAAKGITIGAAVACTVEQDHKAESGNDQQKERPARVH